MTRRSQTKLIHEGQYAAEVDVQLIDEEGAWSPYLSLEDARKLDEVRLALRREDLRLQTDQGNPSVANSPQRRRRHHPRSARRRSH